MIRKVQKTAEVHQIKYIVKIIDMPVQIQRQIPMVQKVKKTVGVPQIQFIDEIVDVPAQEQRQVQTMACYEAMLAILSIVERGYVTLTSKCRVLRKGGLARVPAPRLT